MSNSPRYLPPGTFLAEITQRCLLGHYLLRPSERLNKLITGVVAKAQEKYPVEVVGLAVPSNHYHLIATGTSQKDLSAFMNFVAGNVAQEAGRLHGWRGKVWKVATSAPPSPMKRQARSHASSTSLLRAVKKD